MATPVLENFNSENDPKNLTAVAANECDVVCYLYQMAVEGAPSDVDGLAGLPIAASNWAPSNGILCTRAWDAMS
jgi:hypothetical protein